MPSRAVLQRIDIRPGVDVLGLFRHLNYRPWYAMAEFVDNALQSFLSNRTELERVEGKAFRLRVAIETDTAGDGRIVIRDNAAGIAADEYARAFKPASPPPDKTGLSEFGIGMKSAACWFARRWTVRSAALGEQVVRELAFDVDQILKDHQDWLAPKETPKKPDLHFTEVTLQGLHSNIRGKTLSKVKEHLGSMYRCFLRDGDLEFVFDGEPLGYKEPAVLVAHHHKKPSVKPVTWRKEIDVALDGGIRLTGTAFIREKGSGSAAGFSLFRRRRLIVGSADETYRPRAIFGSPNSFPYQRLSGELHVEGLGVSHTKDGFQWDGHEEEFLAELAKQLDAPPLPMLDQADKYRKNPKLSDLQPAAEQALDNTAAVLERYAQEVLETHFDRAEHEGNEAQPVREFQEAKTAAKRDVHLRIRDTAWTIHLELTADPAVGDWYSISQRPKAAKSKHREMGVRVALDHPFMNQFSRPEYDHIEPLVRVAIAFALAETTARETGMTDPGDIRLIANDLLRSALWNP